MLNLENWLFGVTNEGQLDSAPHLLGAAVGLLAFLIIGRPISDWFIRLLWVPGAGPLTCATLLEQTLIFIGSRALTLDGLVATGAMLGGGFGQRVHSARFREASWYSAHLIIVLACLYGVALQSYTFARGSPGSTLAPYSVLVYLLLAISVFRRARNWTRRFWLTTCFSRSGSEFRNGSLRS